MSDHSITSLIEKLEGATGGSRELDALIWLRFNRPEYAGGVKALEMRGWYDGRGHMVLETDTCEEVADDLGIGTYTTSLDAALALLGRTLSGWIWCVAYDDQFPEAKAYRVWIANDRKMVVENPLRSVGAATPALALCAAILRAQSEAR